MQNLTNAQANTNVATTLPARPAAARVKSAARMAYIDIARMILIILVILVHTAVTYGSTGDWTYRDTHVTPDTLTVVLLSLFVIICQSFFMGLFFFYSGYFTPGSYDHKGLARFWKDRLLRLALPMLVYTYFLSRIPSYLDETANHGLVMPFWSYVARTALRSPDAGPTWFLFALLVFSLGYTLWRLAARELNLDLAWADRLPAPGTKALLCVALIFSAAMFIMAQVNPITKTYQAFGAYNLLLAFFPAYILLFSFGILAYRNQWLASMPSSLLRTWALISAGLIILLPIFLIASGAIDYGLDIFLSGLSWRCAGVCLWMGFACVAFSITLTLWLRGRVQAQSKVAALAAPDTFAVYLIHPLVLVPLSYAMSFVALPAMAKFLLVGSLTVALCYLIADGLRRLPGAKAIL